MSSDYPENQIVIGPLQSYYDGCFENITINNKTYKCDIYGNITGYRHCILGYDSNLDLEEIGFWDQVNNRIIDYHFGYSYHK